MGLLDNVLRFGSDLPRRRMPEFEDTNDDVSEEQSPTAAAIQPLDTSSEYAPVDRSRLNDLTARRAALDQPMTLKQKLIKAAVLGAPMLIGGAFGGMAGAAGAGAGVSDVLGREEKEKEFQEHDLTQEMGEESRNVGLMERVRAGQIENSNRDALAQSRLDQQAKAEADRDALTRGHYADEKAHWTAEENKPQPFNLERELFDAESAANPDALNTPQGKVGLLKQVQAGAHPYHVPPVNLQILPNASGGIGGTFNPRQGTIGAPPDQSAAPSARKSAEPTPILNRDIQATAIGQSLHNIEGMIDSNKALMGPLAGRVQTIEQLWGDPSPAAMKLKGMMLSHFSLIPAMHGMRSNQMVENFNRQYGKLKFTPEALKGALEGASSAAPSLQNAIRSVYGNPTGGGEQQAAPAANPNDPLRILHGILQ